MDKAKKLYLNCSPEIEEFLKRDGYVIIRPSPSLRKRVKEGLETLFNLYTSTTSSVKNWFYLQEQRALDYLNSS